MEVTSHVVIKDGQARIEGKEHIKAEMVARMVVDGNYSIEDVINPYSLTPGEVHSALAYYYDNQAALDTAYQEIVTEIHDNAMTLEKFKAKLASKTS